MNSGAFLNSRNHRGLTRRQVIVKVLFDVKKSTKVEIIRSGNFPPQSGDKHGHKILVSPFAPALPHFQLEVLRKLKAEKIIFRLSPPYPLAQLSD